MNQWFQSPVLIILAVWSAVLTVLLIAAFVYYKRLTQGSKKKNLLKMLKENKKTLSQEKKRTDDLEKRVKELEEEILSHVQKIGLIRFNPFAETGGNQSFCLSLLDSKDNGLVISSLHSREGTRVYAKPIKAGKEAGYAFSSEEKRAIKGAKKIK
jgi:hypothetical protein